MAEIQFQEETGTPATPGSGKWKIYPKSDGFYFLDDTGKELGPLLSSDGWIPGTGTWSYSSADSPVFVASIPDADAALMQAGDRIKLTQTTEKFFIVVLKGTPSGGFTPVTIYGGTDYTLANAAITSPFWSHEKRPFGFPATPLKWTVSTITTDSPVKSSPTSLTWYGGAGLTPTGPSIIVPIGSWRVFYRVIMDYSTNLAAASNVGVRVTLSTANNSESDPEFTSSFTNTLPVSSSALQRATYTAEKDLVLTSKTTYYLNVLTGNAVGTGPTLTLNPLGAFRNVIKAVCTYL